MSGGCPMFVRVLDREYWTALASSIIYTWSWTITPLLVLRWILTNL